MFWVQLASGCLASLDGVMWFQIGLRWRTEKEVLAGKGEKCEEKGKREKNRDWWCAMCPRLDVTDSDMTVVFHTSKHTEKGVLAGKGELRGRRRSLYDKRREKNHE